MNRNKSGHIYILSSPNSDFIKIGGTDYSPMKRIREINVCNPYKEHGPWSLVDFRQVTDWRTVESSIHYSFRSKLVKSISSQKELFNLPLHKARKALDKIGTEQLLSKPKVDRMFQDESFTDYLLNLFNRTGLFNWLDIQGSWSFSLFPATSGGRYFTLNIGKHEVAFSSFSYKGSPEYHMIYMDKLILEFPKVINWVKRKEGRAKQGIYKSALPRGVSISFSGSFDEATEFLSMEGVRRAIIAYWSDGLTGLKERNSQSLFAKSHNWNAVAYLHKMKEGI